ncbi:hypothetical protein PsorP6_014590 [Peronosclerospora sorghi]|uniref:Uncharacterized protein n=1 Tax=Peronosclerospora sorghi TaxID=230839 RepID=A0ACC0VSE6_9STRA|nr:hypothetical protein PsorP6_014590 [Peronosclerospora sorghi]
MFKFLGSVSSLMLGIASTFGAPVPNGTWPVSQGHVKFSEVYIVKSGTTFDGGMKTYDRSDILCQGQKESNGISNAVFAVEPGATLKNVIIGKNQMEGVHCEMSDCKIENVWWEDVCEDALSIKGGNPSSVSYVLGGGARYADDKVIQFNAYGTILIDGFFAQDFGKLCRSCGNCESNPRQRFVNMSNIYVDVEVIKTNRVDKNVSLVTVNENFGDRAVLHNIHVKKGTVRFTECATSFGVNNIALDPVILSNGPKYPYCQYSLKDVHTVHAGDTPVQSDDYPIDSDNNPIQRGDEQQEVAQRQLDKQQAGRAHPCNGCKRSEHQKK